MLTLRIMGESWIRPATWIVTFCLVFAYVAGLSAGYHALPPVFGYAQLFMRLVIFIVGIFTVWHVVALRGSANPTRTLVQKIQANRDLLASAGIGIGLVMLQLAALTWAKPTLPMFAGFWADPLLLKADAALFGMDTWRLVHAIFGSRSILIDVIYSLWFPVVFGVLFFTFISRNPVKSRLVLTYFFTVTFGILIQFALPSGGPIFYGRLGFGDHFTELMQAIPPQALQGSGYLWGCHVGFRECIAGWGISAWPSMHVALATWVLLAAATLKRGLLTLAVGWWSMILLGSVYLGWHYLLDGIAGTFLVGMAWAIQGKPVALAPWRFGVSRR